MLFINMVVTGRFSERCMHIRAVFNELILYLVPLGIYLLPTYGCFLVVRGLLLALLLIELGKSREILG